MITNAVSNILVSVATSYAVTLVDDIKNDLSVGDDDHFVVDVVRGFLTAERGVTSDNLNVIEGVDSITVNGLSSVETLTKLYIALIMEQFSIITGDVSRGMTIYDALYHVTGLRFSTGLSTTDNLVSEFESVFKDRIKSLFLSIDETPMTVVSIPSQVDRILNDFYGGKLFNEVWDRCKQDAVAVKINAYPNYSISGAIRAFASKIRDRNFYINTVDNKDDFILDIFGRRLIGGMQNLCAFEDANGVIWIMRFACGPIAEMLLDNPGSFIKFSADLQNTTTGIVDFIKTKLTNASFDFITSNMSYFYFYDLDGLLSWLGSFRSTELVDDWMKLVDNSNDSLGQAKWLIDGLGEIDPRSKSISDDIIPFFDNIMNQTGLLSGIIEYFELVSGYLI